MIQSMPLNPGDKYNRLTVIGLNHIRQRHFTKNNKQYTHNLEYYLCKCDCGKETIVEKSELKRGKTKSCGCFQTETRKRIFKNNKFGKKYNICDNNIKNIKLYNIWCGIKKRCYNQNFWAFDRYGGRGITMCEEWKNNFMSFYNWAINNGYKDNLTIDRINNNGNYEPNNCRWVSMKEQCRNKNNNHLLTYNNETHCISEWIELLKMNKNSNVKQVINKLGKIYAK